MLCFWTRQLSKVREWGHKNFQGALGATNTKLSSTSTCKVYTFSKDLGLGSAELVIVQIDLCNAPVMYFLNLISFEDFGPVPFEKQ